MGWHYSTRPQPVCISSNRDTAHPESWATCLARPFACIGRDSGCSSIALIAQIPFLIVEVFTAESFPLGLNLAIAIIGISVGIVLYILVNPAIINAVTWGTSIAGCYRDAANRFWTLFLAAIVFSSTLLLCVALMLIIVGIPLFFHVLISWLFYPQAVMLEGKGPLESLKYSKEMVAGNRWRLLGVGATFFLIGLVLTLALFIPVGILLVFSTTAGNVVGIAATAAVMPIAYIGATLVYFELRGSRDRQIPSA